MKDKGMIVLDKGLIKGLMILKAELGYRGVGEVVDRLYKSYMGLDTTRVIVDDCSGGCKRCGGNGMISDEDYKIMGDGVKADDVTVEGGVVLKGVEKRNVNNTGIIDEKDVDKELGEINEELSKGEH